MSLRQDLRYGLRIWRKHPVPALLSVGMLAIGIAAVTAVWLWTPLAWPWYAVVGSLTTLGVGLLFARRSLPVAVEANTG